MTMTNTHIAAIQSKLQERNLCELQGYTGSAVARRIAQFAHATDAPVCIVTRNDEQAERWQRNVDFFCGDNASIFAPARPSPLSPLPFPETVLHDRLSAISALHCTTKQAIVVMSLEALQQPTFPPTEYDAYTLTLTVQDTVDRDRTIASLLDAGYEHCSMVESIGQIAVRGSLVDCWPPGEGAPIRIEWDIDTITSIRSFHASTQQRIANMQHAQFGPASELIYSENRLKALRNTFRSLADDADIPVPERRTLLESFANRQHRPENYAFLPYLYSDTVITMLDHCPENTLFFFVESATLAADHAKLAQENHAQWAAADSALQLAASVNRTPEFSEWFTGLMAHRDCIIDAPSIPAQDSIPTHAARCAAITPGNHSSKDGQHFDTMVTHVQEWSTQGFAIRVCCHTKTAAERCLELLRWHQLSANTGDLATQAAAGHITIVLGDLQEGFIDHDASEVWLTEAELFGKRLARRTRARKAPRASEAFTSFQDLHPGDLVVHEQHGVARYHGLIHMTLPTPGLEKHGTSQDIVHDFVQLEYAGEDKLYVPVYRLNVLQRFIGAAGTDPMLDKLGSKRWENAKAKATKTAQGMAQQLLALYAERKVREGYAFTGRDHAMEEFEASFPYDETPDQASAIDATLADMQREQPMDRLICGDVGYGKTEVAMRAAFRAAADGRQVALLCPTTLLAYQHAQSFAERFNTTGLRVELLSRFRSTAERKAVLADLAAGTVDIVIGTHRLLSKDVHIPRLGLLIVDEEQRFGVTHKERLREMRKTVDTLSMSATPIPRTLHMAMAGLRDVSIIQTPPADRHAIRTHIVPSGDHVIRTAIEKELSRGGQVFFLHNRVQTIQSMRERLSTLVPHARVQVAHGQMQEDELEQAMRAFMDRKADVLLCTTIIEAGIDIPSANTLIVNRADTFGLAQLYQIRGRVGRSNIQAMAYLLTPGQDRDGNAPNMTALASRRLAALARHTDLGSGFSIAMHDLEMRGAGNLLGAEQSGHVADIGFELFTRMLEKTIRQIQYADDPVEIDPEITLPLPALIPESYIDDANLRLVWYKRLSSATQEEDVHDAEHEMNERFGPIPQDTNNLLQIIVLKIRAQQRCIEQVQYQGGVWRLRFHEQTDVDPGTLLDMVTQNPQRYQMKPDGVFQAVIPCQSHEDIFRTARELLARLML